MIDLERLFIRLAEQTLDLLVGHGTWHQHQDKPWKIDDPMTGLAVGDVLYYYDTDEEELASKTVVLVKDGIGFYVGDYYPKIWPISAGSMFYTEAEALKADVELIQGDLVYCKRHAERAKRLEEYLDKIGAPHVADN